MAVSGEAHVPSGWPLWSLIEDALVELGADGEHMVVRSRWGEIEVSDSSPLVREALHRMTLGPVKLENITALHDNYVRWKCANGGQCKEWRQLKRTLDQLGGGPLLSVIAVTRHVVFTLPSVAETAPIGLRPDTVLEGINGEDVLVCPGAAYQVVLHRQPATLIAKSLVSGDSTVATLASELQLSPQCVADVVAYLMGAGLVVQARTLGTAATV